MSSLLKSVLAAITLLAIFGLIQAHSFSAEVIAYGEYQGVKGEKVALPCNSSLWADESVSLVLWYKGMSEVPIYTLDVRDSTISKSRHISSPHLKDRAYFDVSLNPPLLIVENLTKNDEGAFRCRVDHIEAPTENFVFNLTITVPPKETVIMDAEGQRLEGVIGPYEESSNLLLICEAKGGDPPPSVKWWRGGELIDESFTVGAHGFVRNELLLSDLNRNDLLTVLTCQSSNTELVVPSEISVSLDLTLRPLEVTITSHKRSVSANARTELICRSSGSRPPVMISWWMDGSQLKSMPIRQSVSQDGNLTVNTLSFVASVNDNGKELACRAENVAMKNKPLEEKIIFNVHYVPQVKIVLGAKIDKDVIREDTDVYFECIVNSNPWVTEVSWLFEGSVLFSDPSSGIIISNQSLVLQRVRRQSRGRYRCVAYNSEGQCESKEFFLKVLFAPVCRTGQKTTYGVARDELVQVTCDVDADPANVSFRWLLNNSDTHNEFRSFVENGSRSVASYVPSSSRTYNRMVCWGENSIGRQKDPCVFNIIPASPPEAVHNCSVRNQSFNSLLLACMPGDNRGLSQVFFLEVYISEAQRLHDNISAVDTPEFYVQNLPPGAKFTLNIYAANAKGRSSSLLLAASNLSLPQKQTKVHFNDGSIVSPIVGILVGVVITVVLLTVLVVACIKLKGQNNSGQQPPSDTPSHTKNPSPSVDSFDRMDPHIHCTTTLDESGFYKTASDRHVHLAAFHAADHFQVAFKAIPDVTYAELTVAAPCDTLLGPPVKVDMREYAQLDFDHTNKFRPIMHACETVTLTDTQQRTRSPTADGCSDSDIPMIEPVNCLVGHRTMYS